MNNENRQSPRMVKGSVLVDYLKIVRANPGLPWQEHLLPSDLELINQMILPASWYPAEFLERMGIAIFKLVSGGNYQTVHAFGRGLAERMSNENPGLVQQGEPGRTLQKFMAIQARLYNFKAMTLETCGEREAVVLFSGGSIKLAASLWIASTYGALERLVELSGGREVRSRGIQAVWKGEQAERIDLRWEL